MKKTVKTFTDPAEAAACLAEQLTMVGMSLCSDPEVLCLALHGAARASVNVVCQEAPPERLARFRELMARIEASCDQALADDKAEQAGKRN